MNKAFTDKIREWIKNNNIEKKTMEYFYDNFNSYRNEEEEEFKEYFGDFCKENFYTYINRVYFKLGNWPKCDYSHIIVEVDMIYNDKSIGEYSIYFNFNTEVEDDIFVLY